MAQSSSQVDFTDSMDSLTSITDEEDDDEQGSISEEPSQSSSESEEEEEASDEESKAETEATLSGQQGIIALKALQDFKGQESSDLSFVAGEILTLKSVRADGWWEAVNHMGECGTVPSNYFKVYQPTGVGVKNKSQKFATAFKLNGVMLLPSSLELLLKNNSSYSLESFLKPGVSETGLDLKELLITAAEEKIERLAVPIQRTLTIFHCRQNLQFEPDVKISSCHLRLCLHDGKKVLSNIHTVNAKCNPRRLKIWKFATKNAPSLELAKVFVRSKSDCSTIGILFQPCITLGISSGDVDTSGEISCGWAFLRLLDDNGQSVSNKTKRLLLHQGDPFHSANEKSSPAKAFILPFKLKQPHLLVRLSTPVRRVNKQLLFQPSTLVGCIQDLPLMVMYRRILADQAARIPDFCSELIHAPLLATFPKLFSHPHHLELFRKAWKVKCAEQKHTFKPKVFSHSKQIFTEVYLLTILPRLLSTRVLQEKGEGNKVSRQMEATKGASVPGNTKGQAGKKLSPLLSSKPHFHPLTIADLALDITSA